MIKRKPYINIKLDKQTWSNDNGNDYKIDDSDDDDDTYDRNKY